MAQGLKFSDFLHYFGTTKLVPFQTAFIQGV
ncbi:hypothetical protein SBA5_40018 [Candidatus Sulfotelmatomonas gaucii]|uniref:Uncharacterized protein n=1 Tax=Candidatus Sulfuritelmatomonas gaucii TaxID=2043161 RepID=A0A2N9LK58_9BACT|nr:hypothetical protein SBA5_40018 [Candidatus Sulfotelmatomonas gaucii]